MAQSIDNPIVGIKLLEMLMLKLYNNPRCIYREYIQNALDSINEAVKLRILNRVKDGHVNIHITSNNITIEDNGTGIKSSIAAKLLTDIANSVKNGVDTAGQFGVGRLSGGSYCEVLEFETTYQGENVSTIVSMDMRILRRMLDENNNDISAEDGMRKICSVQTLEAPVDKHNFVVRLKNIINSAEILLNTNEIEAYIKEVAPVDYNTTFSALINSSEQQEFVSRHKSIDKIKVSLNQVPDIEKSYGIRVKGSDDAIEKLRYFELPTHEKYGKMGWGWYAVTEFSVQISDEKDSCAGIRLRKHNISLNKNILNPYFREARGNKYFYGEIFITNENIAPDSGREGLAPGEEADALIKAIKDYFSVLHLVYNKANKLKTRLKGLDELLCKIEDANDSKVRNILSDKLSEQVREYEKFSSPDSHVEVNDVLDIYNKKYRRKLYPRIKEVLYPASNPGPATVQDNPEPVVPEPVPTTKGGSQPVSTTVHGPVLAVPQPTSGSNPEPSRFRPTAPQPPTPPTPPISRPATPPSAPPSPDPRPQSELDEMLMSLQDRQQCTSDQIAILRKVFKTMMIVCPSASKKTLAMLMRAAIESIG